MLFELIITVQNVRRTGSVSSLIIHKAEEVIIVMKHPIRTGLCFKTVIFHCNASFVQRLGSQEIIYPINCGSNHVCPCPGTESIRR